MSPPESSPERDAGIGEPHPPAWSKWGLGNPYDWSRTEEDLECAPHLEVSWPEQKGETTPS